jgi:tetratricopeptide (TPR) repeat protein
MLVDVEIPAVLALLLARTGAVEEADAQVAAALGAAEELGLGSELPRVLLRAARVEALAGSSERAEELLGRALDEAAQEGDDAIRAAIGATMASVLLDRGRPEDARQTLEEVSRSAAGDDVVTQVTWRSALARALASEGRTDEARDLARQALRLAEQTDLMDPRAGALLALAEVLRAEGRPNEAGPFARRALRVLERRGAAVQAERARAWLGSLDRPVGLPAAPQMPAGPEPFADASGETVEPDGAALTADEEPVDTAAGISDAEPWPSPFADIADREPDRSDPWAQPDPEPERRGAEPESAEPEPQAKPVGSWWSFGRR